MSFSVTLLGIEENLQLGRIAEIIRENNERWDPVIDAEWPEDDRLARHWRTENAGQVISVTAGTGEGFDTLITHPRIERSRLRGYWFDRNGNLKPFQDRINVLGKTTFFFEHDGRVWGAIFSSARSPDTSRITKDLLEPYTQVDRKPVAYLAPSDMLYWLLWIVQEYNGTVLEVEGAPATELTLEDVRDYRGFTEEGQSVRGKGPGIIGRLSTLGAVTENAPLTSIGLEVTVGDERVCFSMFGDGSCLIDEQHSRCGFARVPDHQDRQVLMTIFIYTRILPVLHAGYRADLASGRWSERVRSRFIRQTALELSINARARADAMEA